MFSALAVAAATAGVLSGPVSAADVQPNLVGGYPSEPRSWAAALMFDAPEHGIEGAFACTAVLRYSDTVVTGAHCVTDPPGAGGEMAARFGVSAAQVPVEDREYYVRVGSTDRTQGGEVAEIARITAHPRWNWKATDPTADIAVLRLAEPVSAQPVEMARRPSWPGTKVTLRGWGVMSPSGRGPAAKQLQAVESRIIGDRRCAPAGLTWGENCVDNQRHTGACYGDSGGPVTTTAHGREQLVGLISRSWVSVCGGAPTVLTDAVAFDEWVFEQAATPVG